MHNKKILMQVLKFFQFYVETLIRFKVESKNILFHQSNYALITLSEKYHNHLLFTVNYHKSCKLILIILKFVQVFANNIVIRKSDMRSLKLFAKQLFRAKDKLVNAKFIIQWPLIYKKVVFARILTKCTDYYLKTSNFIRLQSIAIH